MVKRCIKVNDVKKKRRDGVLHYSLGFENVDVWTGGANLCWPDNHMTGSVYNTYTGLKKYITLYFLRHDIVEVELRASIVISVTPASSHHYPKWRIKKRRERIWQALATI